MSTPSPAADPIAVKLVELESKLLLLEHDFDALNRAFVQRGEEIVRLQLRVEKLSDQIAEGGGGEIPRPLEENKPPHY